LDRHDLYELCVQSPDLLAPLLVAIHGDRPTRLVEDFCGTGALSRHWASLGGESFATDLDEETLKRAEAPGVTTRHADVTTLRPADHPPADVLFVGNFSIGEIHDRSELVRYLTSAHARIAPGGVFVCDTYGGETSFLVGDTQREYRKDGKRVLYRWEQREADPLTGMVTDAIHFRVIGKGGQLEADFPDAFVYRWRLWSVPELRDAMLEAGFESTGVYNSLPDAVDDEGNAYVEEVTDPDRLGENFICCVAARKAR
jgi:SAM-dependent methyltransferase